MTALQSDLNWISTVKSANPETRLDGQPDTEIGRRIQQQVGMSGVVANRIVRRAGKRLLESLESDSKPKQ